MPSSQTGGQPRRGTPAATDSGRRSDRTSSPGPPPRPSRSSPGPESRRCEAAGGARGNHGLGLTPLRAARLEKRDVLCVPRRRAFGASDPLLRRRRSASEATRRTTERAFTEVARRESAAAGRGKSKSRSMRTPSGDSGGTHSPERPGEAGQRPHGGCRSWPSRPPRRRPGRPVRGLDRRTHREAGREQRPDGRRRSRSHGSPVAIRAPPGPCRPREPARGRDPPARRPRSRRSRDVSRPAPSRTGRDRGPGAAP